MSKYTTGDLAKLSNVSVRTVQYYDTKNLLNPSSLTEGGRRLYNDDDLQKLDRICLLKALGLSLDSIKGILESENSSKITLLLLEEKEEYVKKEMSAMQMQLEAINIVKDNIQNAENITVNSISDINNIMSGKTELKKMYVKMSIMAVIIWIIELYTITKWIITGYWLSFLVGMLVVIPIATLLFKTYYKGTAYICPNCDNKFKPSKREFFFCRTYTKNS